MRNGYGDICEERISLSGAAADIVISPFYNPIDIMAADGNRKVGFRIFIINTINGIPSIVIIF